MESLSVYEGCSFIRVKPISQKGVTACLAMNPDLMGSPCFQNKLDETTGFEGMKGLVVGNAFLAKGVYLPFYYAAGFSLNGQVYGSGFRREMPFHHTPVLFVDKVLIHKTDDSVLGVGLLCKESNPGSSPVKAIHRPYLYIKSILQIIELYCIGQCTEG